MFENIKSLGLSGSLGALLGIGLVFWIEPTTAAGTGVIVMISILLSFVVGGIIKVLSRHSKQKKNK